MIESFISLLQALNSLTPVGIIGLLITVILLMVHKKGPIQTIANNHLSHVQDSLEKIAENSEKTVDLLNDMREDMGYLKGKLDK